MIGSEQLFERACKILVGGVNSPVRAFRAVGGTPLFIKRAQGAYLWDEDGNRYIDYVGSWGPAILGHAHPMVVEAVAKAARDGMSFGAPTEREIVLGEMVREAVPSMELIRFVSSGTEAVMGAVRAARGFTGRDKVLKFAGCYHGHADYLLVKAGSGALTFGEPDSAGVPADFARHTLVAEYNDLENVRCLLQSYPREVAAVIMEPVVGNMGFVPPRPDFLAGLRGFCDQFGALLIFDEVMTGFRVAFGGAQSIYNIRPDLTCLGKVIGGGLPVGAYGGRRDVMGKVAPLGPVYQAGTLSGNPLAMAAGIATLTELKKQGIYDRLDTLTGRLIAGIRSACATAGVACQIDHSGSLWGLFFTNAPVASLADAKRCDGERFKTFFHGMLDRGIYLAPSPFEAGFVSVAHTEGDIDATISVCKETLKLPPSLEGRGLGGG